MPRPTNADLERFLTACTSSDGQPPEPFDLVTCYALVHELLAKRRELRVARSLIVDQGLYPCYASRLAQAKRRKRKERT